jgi:ADP-heptose:LPS heptosyltransferase
MKMSILIIELWGIGDVVLASGVLRVLKNNFPDSKIALLAKKHAKDILANNKTVDEFIIFDFPWTKFRGKYYFWKWDWIGLFKLIRLLRAERFDLILDARGDVRNNLLAFLIGAKRRVGYNWTGGGFFLTDVVKANRNKLHRVDAWATLLRYLGLKDSDLKPIVNLLPEEKEWADVFLESNGIDRNKPLVGIHPGARIKTRCWPLERFVKIAGYLRQKDIQTAFFIEPGGYGENVSLPEGCLKVKVDLRKYMAVVKKLDFLVCNDGGAMHIATAVGTPVVAIFGPTEQEWFGPYGDNNVVVIREGISCRPCSDRCRYKESYCLTSIAVNEVIGGVEKMFNKINLRIS